MADIALAEVFPPGDFIREEIEARGWTQQELADILARPLQTVNEIIRGKKRITSETAQELAHAFGTSPQLWLNLENSYRLSLLPRHDNSIAKRARLRELGPINEMAKRGWIAASGNVDKVEEAILRFYDLNSLEETPRLGAAARKSTSYGETTPSEMAWLYRAKQLAGTLKAPEYTIERFSKGLTNLRRLSASERAVQEVPRVLSEMGIRFVVVKHLPKMKTDGITFWLDDQSPVIAVSFRYSRIDWFWHTLGHELWHIKKKDVLVLENNLVGPQRVASSDKPKKEQEADRMASKLLLPQQKIEGFIAKVRPYYSRAKIVDFATGIGVHPGIVVGQLQFRGEIPYSHSRALLVNVRDYVIATALVDGWEQQMRSVSS